LGTLFAREHMTRALKNIQRLNRCGTAYLGAVRADGRACVNPPGAAATAEAHWAWPAQTRAHLHCLQLYRGAVAEGLRGVEGIFQAVAARQRRWFDEPLQWNPDSDDAPPGSTGRHAGALSYWYVLYALQGFLLNIPEQYLRVTPNLPEGVRALSAPLITPICLGWLKYKIDDHEGYRQRLKVSFDSPVHVKHVELRVPGEVKAVNVTCETADGVLPLKYVLKEDGDTRRLLIQFDKPAGVAPTGLAISVVRAATAPPSPQARGPA
ncbi:MAG TPA: hypothetical protein PKL84_03300, partial [Candidatus Hydrogenedentes bacterium]|nr:hypothetical protein [Candidatus Hydrogenedentota bacterium]